MSYHTVPADRIPELRKLADKLTINELNALVVMWGLRNVQAMNVDLVESGDCDPDDIIQTPSELAAMAADMVCDMITPEDLRAIAKENDLGDYSVIFRPTYKAIRKV